MMNHSEWFPWGSVTYWKDGVASSVSAADTAEINVKFGLCGATLRFAIADKHTLDATKHALDLAIKLGDRQARREIRESLGLEK